MESLTQKIRTKNVFVKSLKISLMGFQTYSIVHLPQKLFCTIVIIDKENGTHTHYISFGTLRIVIDSTVFVYTENSKDKFKTFLRVFEHIKSLFPYHEKPNKIFESNLS